MRFVDGPELDLNHPATLPVSGTASYQGSSGGLYATRYGTDAAVPAGSQELGEFSAVATLTANFSSGTIEGCVGCVGSILLSGVYYDATTGDAEAFEDFASDYQLRLGTVSFDRSNATFEGTDVTLSHLNVPITQSSGVWAGQFSNLPIASDDPRLVAGTFGGQGSTSGGSQAVFVGAFAAGKQ